MLVVVILATLVPAHHALSHPRHTTLGTCGVAPHMALAAVSKRQAPKKVSDKHIPMSKSHLKHDKVPLFIDEDAELQIALQESLQQQNQETFQQALEASSTRSLSSDTFQPHISPVRADLDDDDDM